MFNFTIAKSITNQNVTIHMILCCSNWPNLYNIQDNKNKFYDYLEFKTLVAKSVLLMIKFMKIFTYHFFTQLVLLGD